MCYTLFSFIEAFYFIYYYPGLVHRFILGNLIRMIPGVIICILFIIISLKIEEKYSSRRNMFLIVSFIFISVIAFIDSLIVTYIYSYLDSGEFGLYFGQFITLYESWILFFFGAGILFHFISFHRKSVSQELQLTLTKALAEEARLMMLRYQINPDFFLNTLNTIETTIKTDRERAKTIIGELSEYFRYTLSKNDQVYVSLEDEINALKNYLSIQKEQYGELLDITYEIDPDTYAISIPFFIIHPLVENALNNGFASVNDILRILIKTEISEYGLIILVKNSGSRQTYFSDCQLDQISGKSGIENLKKRLALLYPDSYELLIFEENGFVNSVIKIPGSVNKT